MSVSDNLIASWAADLFELEDQIEALQDGKKDLYGSIRDEHGKQTANALKRAVKLARMDSEKRDEADAIDTEAQRMLAIIESGTVDATHVARGAREDEHEPAHSDPSAAAVEAQPLSPAEELQPGSSAPIQPETAAPVPSATEGANTGGEDEPRPLKSAPATEPASSDVGSVVPFTRPDDGRPRSSTGLPRPHGCKNVETCATTWRAEQPCSLCRAELPVQPGGTSIRHEGRI